MVNVASKRISGRRGTAMSLHIATQLYIQQGPRYLITGTILGALGFLIAVIPFIMRLINVSLEGCDLDVGAKAAKGTTKSCITADLLPGTVSELVADWKHVEARVFFGFELCASACILLSWYPFKMQNACCIPSLGGCRVCLWPLGSFTWASFRQFVPPLGLLMIACVPTVPPDQYVWENLVLVAVHCIAAMLMFAGFLMAEAHVLHIWPFRCTCRTQAFQRNSKEHHLRFLTWLVAFIGFTSFMAIQIVGGVVDLSRRWKVASFLTEVIAGLSMLANQFVIWEQSPERHLGRLWRQNVHNLTPSAVEAALENAIHSSETTAGRDLAVSLHLATQQFVQESTRYLLVGVVLGIVGFFVTILPFSMRILRHGVHELHHHNITISASMSELVSSWDDVETRVFFGFEFAAALCILLSWHPFELRNACCHPSAGGCSVNFGWFRCCFGAPYWATYKQFSTPLALLLICTVPTIHQHEYGDPSKIVLVLTHAAASYLKHFGFLFSEAHVLSVWPFYCRVGVVQRGSAEYRWRFQTWLCALLCFLTFSIVQMYIKLADFVGWIVLKRFRITSFFFDVMASLALLTNHYIIWYFCAERRWSKRGCVALRASSVEANLDGRWHDTSNVFVASISGAMVTWSDGKVSTREIIAEKTLIIDGSSAKLEDDGKLRWQNGKIWSRVEEDSHQSPSSSFKAVKSLQMVRQATENSLELVPQQFLIRSQGYLIVGVLLGVLGFVIAVIPFIMRVFMAGRYHKTIHGNMLPATVSELVSQWDETEARVFFGFELGASLYILLSWYPYNLQNACCVPTTGGCYVCNRGRCTSSLPWATFRQFVPPLGLLMVACVPTVPPDEYNLENFVLVGTHCVAAMMMFFGFLMSEAHALSIWPFKCGNSVIAFGTQEHKLRFYTWFLGFLTFTSFTIIQAVGGVVDLSCRRWKVLSFLLEVVAGLSMLANHFTIWTFCSERHWNDPKLTCNVHLGPSFADGGTPLCESELPVVRQHFEDAALPTIWRGAPPPPPLN